MAKIEHSGTQYPFEFRGKGGEYFKIWIVNILLTILTLYIYSAWAKVRNKRYFYGNTYLNNSSFEYHAKPIQILKGRIFAVIVLIIYVVTQIYFPTAGAIAAVLLLLITPWIISRSIRFNARMSSHRNVRFRFSGKARTLYLYMLLYPLLALLVLGAVIAGLTYFSHLLPEPVIIAGVALTTLVGFFFILPMIQRLMMSYQVNHLQYGTGKFLAKLKTGKFAAILFKLILLYVVMIFLMIMLMGGIVALLAVAAGVNLEELLPALQGGNPESLQNVMQEIGQGYVIAAVALFYLLFLMLLLFVGAYQQSRTRNYVLNATSLDDRLTLSSTLKLFPFFWLLFSNLLITVLTLGLGYPWVKVRTARYFANNTNVYSEGSLDGFVSEQEEKQSSLMEELGDAFDTDFDLGL